MADDPKSRPQFRKRGPRQVPLLLGLFLSAMTLRPLVFGISPLLPAIARDLDTSYAGASLLVTAPLLAMGLFSFAGGILGSHLGARSAMSVVVMSIGVFGAVRVLVPPDAASIVLLSLPIGAAAGAGGALLPRLVKEAFATSTPTLATGVYAFGLQFSGAIAAAVAVPVAIALGGWEAAFLGFALAILAAGVLVRVLLGVAGPPTRVTCEARRNGPVSVRGAVVMFVLIVTVFQGINAWLPALYQERGWSDSDAGLLLGLLVMSQLPATLLAGWLGDRMGSRRQYLVGASALLTVALLALVALPEFAWIHAVVVGVAFGVLSPVILVLPLDLGIDAREVSEVAGRMLGIGYGVAAVVPLVLGAVRDAVGSFPPGFVALAGLAALLALAAFAWTPRQTIVRSGLRTS